MKSGVNNTNATERICDGMDETLRKVWLENYRIRKFAHT